MAEELFKDKAFESSCGRVTTRFEKSAFDEEAGIFRYGIIRFFDADGEKMGSFVTRGSSNDPTAVQVAEAAPHKEAASRFVVLMQTTLREMDRAGVVKVKDEPGSKNMKIIIDILNRH